MKVHLLLDSSDSMLYVGLAKDNKVIAKTEYEANQRHSEFMVPEIDKLLKENNFSKDDLEGVVVTYGPGSYTGVRIAMTIAKTISLALNIPLYSVPSLRAFAYENISTICLMNARGKRSYFAVYNNDEIIVAPTIMDNDLVLKYIDEHKNYVISGKTSYLEIEGKVPPVLDNLAKCSTELYLSDALSARPIYLKDSSTSELKLIVREMNSADIIQVVEIENECFEQPYTADNLKYELLENPFGHLLVAMSGPDIIGYINFIVTFDSASINRIAVRETYRKRGVGNRLLGECVKVCRSGEEPADFLTLEVRKSNENARRFYKKHGFQEIVTKPAYYSDGEDAIYMVRSIINE